MKAQEEKTAVEKAYSLREYLGNPMQNVDRNVDGKAILTDLTDEECTIRNWKKGQP